MAVLCPLPLRPLPLFPVLQAVSKVLSTDDAWMLLMTLVAAGGLEQLSASGGTMRSVFSWVVFVIPEYHRDISMGDSFTIEPLSHHLIFFLRCALWWRNGNSTVIAPRLPMVADHDICSDDR